MTRTYRVTENDQRAAYAELSLLYDMTEIRGFREAARRALARVTWRWRAAAQVLDNAERLKKWHEHNSKEMPASLRDFRRTMAEQQARSDQKRATWPGCERGYMGCTDLTCACVESVPCEQFVVARTARLLRGETT